MQNSITWVGLDVHAESIVLASLAGNSDAVASRAEYPNTPRGRERLAGKLAEAAPVRCVYEAGPCGYDLRRFLDSKGIECAVAAPSLIPRKPGDRVKTDRKDAEKLARLHRMGELATVFVPTPAQEALRDLVRAREDAREDLMRRRHRLSKLLLRYGLRYDKGGTWTTRHWEWIREQKFPDRNTDAVFREYIVAVEQEVERIRRIEAQIEEESRGPQVGEAVGRLRALRGVDTITAMTILTEAIDLKRFRSPRELMAFIGVVPRERSSGGRERRGSITKTGNAHIRRVLIESAWHYQRIPPATPLSIQARRAGQPPGVIEIARKAEMRLHNKFVKLNGRGKQKGIAAVAVARELAGFIWALARFQN
jgi:transposase